MVTAWIRGWKDSGKTMYQILVVEDDAAEADALKLALERYGEENSVTFSIEWMKSAIELPNNRRSFDLIFMDIGLPGISGMEAAEVLRTYDTSTPVIFVTNLAQYAVRGYQVQALDFIVKPIRYGDFAMSMNRALSYIRRNRGRSISISTHDGVRIIDVNDLMYADVMDHNLAYHLSTGETISTRGVLGKLELELSDGPFVRISNSCLVNMAHVRSVLKDSLRITSGEVLYFSRPKRKAALAIITDYLGGSF